VSLNNRDDIVYRTETRFHPELLEVDRRARQPMVDFVPVPWYRPVTTRPSGRPNQLDIEINGGRLAFDPADGMYFGHNPILYADSIPHAGRRASSLYDVIGSAKVVESYTVRVPAGPQDIVPSAKR
jgi:hypothetical protein